MLKRLEKFMRYKKYSVVVYVFLLLMITFMISANRNTQKNSIEGNKISLPVKQNQDIEPIIESREKVKDFFS